MHNMPQLEAERLAPGWPQYIYRLRREGVPITTVPEKHGGSFAGHHCIYVLGIYVLGRAVKVVAAGPAPKGKAA